MSANSRAPYTPAPPRDAALGAEDVWRREVGSALRTLSWCGRTTVTLTPSATSTTLTDKRIFYFSHVTLEPTTASAATAKLTSPGIYVVTTKGSATINHPSNAATDQTFSVLIYNG